MTTGKGIPMLELNVVLVEDEPQLLATLTKILKREVRTLNPFNSAIDAIASLPELEPDVIITDIKMPGMTGLEMVAKLREQNIGTPVVVASAFSDPAYFQEAIRLKVNNFIIKPIQVEELLSELRKIENQKLFRKRYFAQKKLLDDYKNIVDASNIVSKTDRDGRITYVNDLFLEVSGYAREELIGQPHNIVRHPDMPSSLFGKLWSTIQNKKIWQGTIKNLNKDGSSYYVKTTIAPLLDEHGDITEFISIRSDVTPLVEAIDRSRKLEKEKQDYLALIDEYIITSSTDLSGTITDVSKAFCRISQFRPEELIGKNHRIVKHPDMPKELYRDLWQTITHGGIWNGEIKNRARDGSHYWVDATISPKHNAEGETIGYTAIRQDITDKKRVEELSVTDRLTQLYNRHKLDEVFAYEITQSRRYDTPLTIVLLDIDHFKSVNDVHGHLAGDRVLQELADILRTHARDADTVGRWGGEEFLLLLPKTDLEGGMQHAEQLRKVIVAHDFSVIGHKTASFGVAQLMGSDNADRLVERADHALYHAKEAGRNRVERQEDPSD